MKTRKIKSLTLVFIWCLVMILLPIIVYKINDKNIKNNNSYISSDFEIENYNIVLDVDKDSRIDVTENITINIPNSLKINGIYKSIPLWQKYYDNDSEKKMKVEITNLRAIGEKIYLNKTNDSIGIKVGSERTTTDSGTHTYTIKYRYNMGKDLNKKIDELVFNVFDNYDNTSINKISITVNMPENITDTEKIYFFDKDQNITNNIKYYIEGKTINAELDKYILKNSITLKMSLPDGYFIGSTYTYGFISLIICISLIAISIINYILWKKYGKNYEKKCQTVEFYPPEDFDSAQIGYIYGVKSIKKLTASLIIGLASKGYISIEEIEKNKYKIINIGSKRNDMKKLSITEQIVYIELFRNGNENILSEDKSFANVFNKINTTLENSIDKKINDIKARKVSFIAYGLLFASIIAWIISYLYVKDIEPKFEWLYVASFISIFATGFFSIIMERKTTYGEMIIAKVLGFRNYLNVAEKNEIEVMAEKDPNYFYNILPYAYVLGISKKWIGLFDKKNVPNFDLNAIDYYENNFFMIISE